MKIFTRIFISFIFVAIIFMVVLGIDFLQSRKIRENSRWFTNSEEVLRNSADLQKCILDIQTNYRGFMLSGLKFHLKQAENAKHSSDSIFTYLSTITTDNKVQQQKLNQARDSLRNWITSWNFTIKNEQEHIEKRGKDILLREPGSLILTRGREISYIRTLFEQFDQEEYRLRAYREQKLEKSRAEANIINLILGLSAVTIIFGTAFFISFNIRKRIRTLSEATKKIASGNYDYRVEDKSNDELRELSNSVNIMTESLEKTIKSLKQRNEDLEQFAWISSHDLKEPLRMISIFSQKLGQRYITSEEPEAIMQVKFITTSVKKMYDLIDASMRYALMGTTDYIFEKLSTREVIAESLDNITDLIKKTKAKINLLDLPEYIPGIKTLIIELFQNLVENAIKFRGPNAPEIEISARKDQDKWIFTVRDNGIGMNEKYKDQVFLIFHQLAQKTPDYDGIGIGLTYCKKIVELHNGKIWLHSEPGKGTTIYFTIAETALRYQDKSGIQDPSSAV
jgi:signal transduction histidine kinase